jgi:hypothetical protein
MPLAKDRHTNKRAGKQLSVPVAANAVIYMGAMVVANATGFGAPGSTSPSLTYLGYAEAQVDNTGGANGAVNVPVARGDAYKWENSATDPVDQSCLGKVCYIEDDQTVAKTDGAVGEDPATKSKAGIVIGIDDDGVWVI